MEINDFPLGYTVLKDTLWLQSNYEFWHMEYIKQGALSNRIM